SYLLSNCFRYYFLLTVAVLAYVTIGTSRDTSEFACHSIRQWWNNHGKFILTCACWNWACQ
ncbi:ISAzo13-like element transposase-related protein, partial [Crenothrix polyspora]|uniref:ISAzo13-like element transposase-related protein n=1 Tax=Crenothrix polyspora TaxID=360316 RepID=UPI001C3C60FD